jgi:hypothetical protein
MMKLVGIFQPPQVRYCGPLMPADRSYHDKLAAPNITQWNNYRDLSMHIKNLSLNYMESCGKTYRDASHL